MTSWPPASVCGQVTRATNNGIFAEFVIEKEGAPLVLPIEMEVVGKGGSAQVVVFQMILDTGAAHTIFDIKHRAALGAPVAKTAIESPGGPLQIDLFATPRLHLGKLNVQPRGQVACLDMKQARGVFGESVDGILGMDVLFPFVLSIDFDEGRVRIHRAADPSFGERLSITRNPPTPMGLPMLRCAVGNGDPLDFLIDTGGTAMVSGGLEHGAYDGLVERRELSTAADLRTVKLWNGTVFLRYGRTTVFSAGPFVHDGLMFGRFPINCLGLGYLSRYFVAFDFPKNVMYLKPGAGFSRPDLVNLSGMEIVRRDDCLVVASATPDTEAAAVGIGKDDEIVAVDGRPARDLTVMAVRRRLCEEGHLTLSIRRGDEQRSVVLDLRQAGQTGQRGETARPNRAGGQTGQAPFQE